MNTTLVEPVESLETWFESIPRPHPGIQSYDVEAILGVGRHEAYAISSGSLVSYPFEDAPAHSSLTISHHSGLVLWPASTPFENSVRWRESAQRLQRLRAAQAARTKPTFSTHVVDSLDPAVASQVLRYLRAQPKCPLAALVFAAMVTPLGPVEKVVCQGESDELRVWTIVNRATDAQRYAVYDREWELMQMFREQAIDFRLLDREDNLLERLVEWGPRVYVIE